jgi:hypothetical protein
MDYATYSTVVTTPPRISDFSFTTSKDEVALEEVFTLTLQATNTGGDADFRFKVDETTTGVTLADAWVRLPYGWTGVLTVYVRILQPGTYNFEGYVYAENEAGVDSEISYVSVKACPIFSDIRDLTVSPSPVEPGGALTISYEVYGTGAGYPYETQTILIDGEQVACYQDDFPCGTWNRVTRTITVPATPGGHTIEVRVYGDWVWDGHCGWADASATTTFTVGKIVTGVHSATVYWRYGSSLIDANNKDGSMAMSGPVDAPSSVWSADIPAPGDQWEGQTIYWRVYAATNATPPTSSWSPSYIGGLILDDDTVGPVISDVQVSEYLGNGDGVIDDTEQVKISWSLYDPSGIGSTSCSIDDVPQAVEGSYYVIAGPYSAGTHNYRITAEDNDNSPASSEVTGSFEVVPAVAVEDYIPYYYFSLDESYYPASFYFDGDFYVENNHENYDAWVNELPLHYVYINTVEDENYFTIQYWLYYAYNDYPAPVQEVFDHEHDWEVVHVVFDKSNLSEPIEVRYAHHEWVEQVDWDSVEKVDSHPIVYVANGSHGSYHTPDVPWYDVWEPNLNLTPFDFNSILVWNDEHLETTLPYVNTFCFLDFDTITGVPQPEPFMNAWPRWYFGEGANYSAPWHRDIWTQTRPEGWPDILIFGVRSVVDLHVYDPVGRHVGLNYETGEKEIQIPNATYLIVEDGQFIDIPNPIEGSYEVQLVGTADGTYKFGTYRSVNGTVVYWKENLDIPITEKEVHSFNITPLPTIPAEIDIDPDTLNLRSKGKWITTYIELPEGYDVRDINAGTIFLNETIQPVLDPKYDFVTNESEYIKDYDGDGILERMVKFSRREVQALIGLEGDAELTITGKVNETAFKGSDTIRAIKPREAIEMWIREDLARWHSNPDENYVEAIADKLVWWYYSIIPSDLAVDQNDIVTSNPISGQELTINVTIHNYGDVNAGDFKVELLVDRVSIANNTLSLNANSEKITQFIWFAEKGAHDIKIAIDPDDIIKELTEANNIATVKVKVKKQK